MTRGKTESMAPDTEKLLVHELQTLNLQVKLLVNLLNKTTFAHKIQDNLQQLR